MQDSGANPVPKIKKDEKAKPDAENGDPKEIVSKKDYQFNQALTLLKGVALLQSR